jgi:hypothetical protein
MRVCGSLTWCAVRGDDALKIMQRAGHADFETTRIYLREAEKLSAGFGAIFPPVPADLRRASQHEREGFRLSASRRGAEDGVGHQPCWEPSASVRSWGAG